MGRVSKVDSQHCGVFGEYVVQLSEARGRDLPKVIQQMGTSTDTLTQVP